MARGRMVTNLISKDKDVNNLVNDTCRLLFTWLVTFADREGRTYGDASIVRSTVFPRRTDITIEQVEDYLQELHGVGLILRYTANDEQYILFPAFEKNQIGMRKEREPSSDIPAPSVADLREYCRKFAGKKPEVCRTFDGLIEVEGNGMEGEGEGNKPPAPPISKPGDPADRVWRKIKPTSLTIPPSLRETVIPVIDAALSRNARDEDATAAEGKQYFDAYCKTRNKRGGFYSPSGTGWIDWWAQGTIPQNGNGKQEGGYKPTEFIT